MHIRSPHANAKALIMTHGWPGSILEFRHVIARLTEPVKYGGKVEDAFHLVLPSLPGYGFSGKPMHSGCNVVWVAKAWGTVMQRLGYKEYFAQGGDWGASVTARMANLKLPGLMGVHLNSTFFDIRKEDQGEKLTAEEQKAVHVAEAFLGHGDAYYKIHGTRPQTIGYALVDSPAGQAAWIYEKIYAWTDHNVVDFEDDDFVKEILDSISLYWVTESAASSARMYWENVELDTTALKIEIPVGVSLFPADLFWTPRSRGERYYKNIVYWNGDVDKGGHFAAWEVPEIFVRELRETFVKMNT